MRNPGRFGVLTLLVERISDGVCRKHSRLAHVVRFSAHILIIVGLSAVTVACGEATQEWERVEKLGPRTYWLLGWMGQHAIPDAGDVVGVAARWVGGRL